jgi:hypothetical protein
MANHGGFFRLKLCKLNSPTDMATQECFDQNILKISPVVNYVNETSPKFYGNNYDKFAYIDRGTSLQKDDYTIIIPETATIPNVDGDILI